MDTDISNDAGLGAADGAAPTLQKGTVKRGRLGNAAYRPREYLTPKEIERLMAAARKRGRYGHRDETAILIAYRHGLRASELCALRWDMIDFARGQLHVHRLKEGRPSVHPLGGIEIRALRRLQRESEPGRYVFMTERGGPVTREWFKKMIERSGEAAKLPFPVHPHMLRHSCGFKLANDGQDTRAIQHYLGHRSLQSTMRYTELSPKRFENFWKD
jgi:integrase